jgi:hypothetical protein
VAIEFPHSGTGVGQGHGRRADRLGQAADPVHLGHDLVHAVERLDRLVDDEIGAIGHQVEVIVGDERGDLQDHVTIGVESGHLQVDPGQHGRRS